MVNLHTIFLPDVKLGVRDSLPRDLVRLLLVIMYLICHEEVLVVLLQDLVLLFLDMSHLCWNQWLGMVSNATLIVDIDGIASFPYSFGCQFRSILVYVLIVHIDFSCLLIVQYPNI